jgi:mRNA interferase RelE/StbE
VTGDRWDLIVPRPARRTIDRLPVKVAVAAVNSILGPLIESPRRVGKPLRGELAGLYSAPVGAYSMVYEVVEASSTVNVLDIDHRADVYRPR